jgi:hypothetical protein
MLAVGATVGILLVFVQASRTSTRVAVEEGGGEYEKVPAISNDGETATLGAAAPSRVHVVRATAGRGAKAGLDDEELISVQDLGDLRQPPEI